MGLRATLRRALERVGRRVERDDLFEKPGERPPTAPLAPAPPVAGSPRAVGPSRAAPAAELPARPAAGCVPVDLAGLRAALVPSGRPLVVNHWATWCDPCVEELPRLVRAHAGAADLADFLGVSWDLFDHPGDPEAVAKKVARFADGMGVGYPSVLYTGTPESLFAGLGLGFELIPQTLVLGADGRVAWHHRGMLTDDDVEPLLRAVRGGAA